ncbi:MAG: hypothetical protein WKF81_07460 [Thermomicrobiales bacterium]
MLSISLRYVRGVVMKRLAVGSLSLRLFVLFALILATAGFRVEPMLAQGEITTVTQGGGLPGVPADVPIAGELTTELEAGEYQWQTTSLTTGERTDEPIEVHRGFLLSLDQSIIVIKAGAPSRAVAAGSNIELAESERIKPLASGDTPGTMVLVEFVLLSELRDDEAPDQVLPVTLEAGTYTIALLDITNLSEDGPSAGELIEQAAGPAFSIESRGEDDPEDIPLVVWLATIFDTGSESETDPDPTAAVDDEEVLPTVASSDVEIDRIEDESESTPADEDEDEDEQTPSPTSEPTIEPTPDSFSDEVDEASASASDAPFLAGVPSSIPVVSYAVFALPAGDYQWQTRNLLTHTRGEHDVMTFGNGFIIATQGPVTVLRSNETSIALDQGEALAIEQGDEILPTSTNGDQITFMAVELVPMDDATDPDLLNDALPLTLSAGIYTIAVLDVSGVGANGPTPGEIIGGAAGPGFGISGSDTQIGESDLTWLVSVFGATQDDLIAYEAKD